MATYLGIDIGQSAVRAALIRTSYRKVTLAGVGAAEYEGEEQLGEAIRFAAGQMALRCDGIAVSLPGEQLFVRKLEIPATAAKQMAEVVPFEIEAQLPFELSDAVFDYRALPKARDRETIDVFAAVARTADVKAKIDLFSATLGHEPEMVLPGAFSLAALALASPDIAKLGTFALVDLGAVHTDVVVVQGGEVVFARTLLVGTKGLPETARQLARELKQTFAGHRAGGGAPVEALFLVGGGSLVQGAAYFLAGELSLTRVEPLPLPKLEGVDAEMLGQLPFFAKSLALCYSLAQKGRSLNLRQGPLTYERGFGFLREKIPVLAGLGVVIVVSSLFSTWAEVRSLSREREVLEAALAQVSKEVVGEEIRDAERAREVLEQGTGGKDDDPLPQVDALDVLVQIAEAVPSDMKHDIEELDVQRAGATVAPHVTVHGIVPKVQDAEDLAAKLKEYPCFNDVKIVKTSQQVGGEAQKYLMEFELKCVSPDKKKQAAGAGSAQPASSAKGADK